MVPLTRGPPALRGKMSSWLLTGILGFFVTFELPWFSVKYILKVISDYFF